MPFEDIECVKPAAPAKSPVPDHGVSVAVRTLGIAKRAGGGQRAYIRLCIGAVLARAISLTKPEQRLRLLFGTGSDAGKVQVAADQEGGKFLAKRDKKGNYALTINAATADGLFALSFPAFCDHRCEALRLGNGQPPYFVFNASKEMLAVEED